MLLLVQNASISWFFQWINQQNEEELWVWPKELANTTCVSVWVFACAQIWNISISRSSWCYYMFYDCFEERETKRKEEITKCSQPNLRIVVVGVLSWFKSIIVRLDLFQVGISCCFPVCLFLDYFHIFPRVQKPTTHNGFGCK